MLLSFKADVVATMNTEKSKPETKQAESITSNGDISTAAALRAQYAIEVPKLPRRRHKKLTREEAETPLIDDTAALTLHSKKTERRQKRLTRKAHQGSGESSLLDLPTELLIEVFSYLQVSDVFRISRACRTLQSIVLDNESVIVKQIILRRYWILWRCFPCPIRFDAVPSDYHSGLLSEKRQDLLNIHRKSYHQHVEMVDPTKVCTCMTCVFAWNNLCLLVDLHHWQKNLDSREPIPMIPRGTMPEWNTELLTKNADIVRRAMEKPFTLYYAAILEKHLSTITRTILRSSRSRKTGTVAKPRLYNMTDWDVNASSDAFLARKGPPSYDFPFHRDVYYSLEAYLPNRKFDNGTWHYYALPPVQHEKDLEWVKMTFYSALSSSQRQAQALANLKDHNIRWSQYLEQVQKV